MITSLLNFFLSPGTLLSILPPPSRRKREIPSSRTLWYVSFLFHRLWIEPYHCSSTDYVDPGTRADPKKPHLLNPNVTTRNISPYLGTEISGVQISELTKEGLDELALFTAERKVLIFRDQNFKDVGPDRQIELAKSVFSIFFLYPRVRSDNNFSGRHFGPIQRHAFSANVKGYPEFHVGESTFTLNKMCAPQYFSATVYRDPSYDIFKQYTGANRASDITWHSDISYEMQPAGTTFFIILEQVTISRLDVLSNVTYSPHFG